jgi:hypothetical protein
MCKRAAAEEDAVVDWYGFPHELWREIFSHCGMRLFLWPVCRLWRNLFHTMESERISNQFVSHLRGFPRIGPRYCLRFASPVEMEGLVERMLEGNTPGMVRSLYWEMERHFSTATYETVMALYRDVCCIRSILAIKPPHCDAAPLSRKYWTLRGLYIVYEEEGNDLLLPFSHSKHLLLHRQGKRITRGTWVWSVRFRDSDINSVASLEEAGAFVRRALVIPTDVTWNPVDARKSEVMVLYSEYDPEIVLRYLNRRGSARVQLERSICNLLTHLSTIRVY